MNKWTPGPWSIHVNQHGEVDVHDGTEHECTSVFSVHGANQKENAHLIASAPDLVLALEDLLSGWRYIRETHGDLYGVGWDRTQKKAEKAIAKARGES